MTEIDFSKPNTHERVEFKAWLDKLEKDLKGRSPDTLKKSIELGLEVDLLFPTQLKTSSAMGAPGKFPFARGTQDGEQGWHVCQKIDHPLPQDAAKCIQEDLNGGVDSLWVSLREDETLIQDVGDVEQIFEHVDLKQTPIFIDTDRISLAKQAHIFSAVKKKGVDLSQLRGAIGYDPFSEMVRSGILPGGEKGAMSEMAELNAFCSEHTPQMHTLLVSAVNYERAGATCSEQLAWTLATGLFYLKELKQKGLTVEDLASKLLLRFAVGNDFFAEISKLRAARILWSKMFHALGVKNAHTKIHAVTSQKNKTKKDPWVNMLRATAESFAAAAGGADFVTTLGFDDAVGISNSFARRIARNTQTILREESHVHRVLDPAGGSGYIDWLTDQLARKAWDKFQSIEEAGGMYNFISSSALHESLQQTAMQVATENHKRKDSIIGVSVFANLSEEPIKRQKRSKNEGTKNQIGHFSRSIGPETHFELSKELMAVVERRANSEVTPGEAEHVVRRLGEIQRKFGRVVETWLRPTEGPTAESKETKSSPYKLGMLFEKMVEISEKGADVTLMNAVIRAGLVNKYVQPLQCRRDAESWESLREASDYFLQKHGGRPKAFLATLGNLKDYKIRAGFAEQLLAAGGIEAVTYDGFENADEVVLGFKKSKTIVAVICGKDEAYEEDAEIIIAKLKEAGAKQVLLAGHPSKIQTEKHSLTEFTENLRKAGLDDFIYQGADVIAVLQSLHKTMGLSEFIETREPFEKPTSKEVKS